MIECALLNISLLTWEYTFIVCSTEWPNIFAAVLKSTPLAINLVAYVCLNSWREMLKPYSFKSMFTLERIVFLLLKLKTLLSIFIIVLYFNSSSETELEMGIILIEFLLLTLPNPHELSFSIFHCLLTLIRQLLKSISFHVKPCF